MSYSAYWGEKRGPNGMVKSPRVVSYQPGQVADKGAYRLLKQGWDVVRMEYFNSWGKPGHNYRYFLFFIDEQGVFGKKKGVIKIDLGDCKGSGPTYEEVRRHGCYILSDGGNLYFDALARKKKSGSKNEDDYGIKGDWHPFGL